MKDLENKEYYSWTVIDELTMIKRGDKSFFEYKSSGVPKDIRWFFNAEHMSIGEHKDITFKYLNNEYPGRVEIAALNRCRISWHGRFEFILLIHIIMKIFRFSR